MVVRRVPEGWVLVTQPDHAELAGQLARHWSYSSPPRSEDPEFLAAVCRHDAGWASVDVAPRLHPDGSPVTFLEWPLASAVEIWQHSIETARAIGPTAGYVVARHFCVLGKMAECRALSPADRAGLQQFLRSNDGAVDAAKEPLTRLLQLCDVLSLELITGDGISVPMFKSAGITVSSSGGCVRLNPFPFDGPLSPECPARLLRAKSKTIESAAPLSLRLC